MDWSGGREVRLLAGAYLASWVSWLIGVIWTLINQLTGSTEPPGPVIGWVLFLVGAAGVTALAYVLRGRVPNQAGKSSGADYQRAWHRLALGIELRRAWLALSN